MRNFLSAQVPKPAWWSTPAWPYRSTFFNDVGYVVWRDVFEGDMRCTLKEAALAHMVATFVQESDALWFCDRRNKANADWPESAQ